MKKFILFFIALQAFFFPAFAAGGTVTFDNSRTVVILGTTQDNYAATYLSKSIREPFRIPYWNRIDAGETISSKDITVARFEELAAKYGADLVIIPFVNHWYWRQYHNILTYEDDIYTEYNYRLSAYVYNRETGTVETYGVNGRGREEAITLNNPDDVLRPAVKRLLEKLPYKRIPADRRYNDTDMPVLDTYTTAGGAKIYRGLDGPIPI